MRFVFYNSDIVLSITINFWFFLKNCVVLSPFHNCACARTHTHTHTHKIRDCTRTVIVRSAVLHCTVQCTSHWAGSCLWWLEMKINGGQIITIWWWKIMGKWWYLLKPYVKMLKSKNCYEYLLKFRINLAYRSSINLAYYKLGL